jgi:hypothetical protein
MSVGRSIQYTTKQAILDAYEDFEVPSWAITTNNGKQFLVRYKGDSIEEGGAKLDKFLSDLLESKSMGIYTLLLYEEPGEVVNIKTPYDLSFNFRFNVESENYVNGLGGPPREYLPALLSEIKELRKKIDDLERERDDDDEPEKDTLGRITELLSNPQIAALLGRLLPPQNGLPQSQPGQLSGIEQDQEKLTERAIEILRGHDPQLGTHLMKIAEIAVKSKSKFSTLISILDSM